MGCCLGRPLVCGWLALPCDIVPTIHPSAPPGIHHSLLHDLSAFLQTRDSNFRGGSAALSLAPRVLFSQSFQPQRFGHHPQSMQTTMASILQVLHHTCGRKIRAGHSFHGDAPAWTIFLTRRQNPPKRISTIYKAMSGPCTSCADCLACLKLLYQPSMAPICACITGIRPAYWFVHACANTSHMVATFRLTLSSSPSCMGHLQ